MKILTALPLALVGGTQLSSTLKFKLSQKGTLWDEKICKQIVSTLLTYRHMFTLCYVYSKKTNSQKDDLP